MENHITVGLKQARLLNLAGWVEPTQFYWGYNGMEKIVGKIWKIYHKSEKIYDIDSKDIIPAAPTPEEMMDLIKKKQPEINHWNFNVKRGDKLANVMADYILKNKLLNR